jgi:steroid delta-isomerase-like uncharacterized protein
MITEQNKIIVSRFYQELWNKRQLDVADQIIAPDCITHQLESGADPVGVARGPAAVKLHVREWLTGFPDLRFEVEQMLAEEDRVVSYSVMHGTHDGTWLSVAPTGKRVSIRLVVMQRIKDGKIAEDWVHVEVLGFLQQLGLIASTAEILGHAAK